MVHYVHDVHTAAKMCTEITNCIEVLRRHVGDPSLHREDADALGRHLHSMSDDLEDTRLFSRPFLSGNLLE